MKHFGNLTPSGRALVAAGKHLQKKDGADPFDILAKKFGDHTDEVIRRLDSEAAERRALEESVRVIEQKAAYGGGVPSAPPTWGNEFIKTKGDDLAALSQSPRGQVSLNVKSVTTGAASAGALDNPFRDPTVETIARRRMTVRDLLQVVQVSSGSTEYVNQTGRTNNAAPVAEGASKPESDMAFELKTTSAKVIAHWVKASRQILEDAPQLRDIIDTELRYGLMLVEEAQLLLGDGTGQNLTGLVPNATAYALPTGLTVTNDIDMVGAAILQSALAEYPATGVMLNPADWMRMRLAKDADGNYILGAPAVDVQPRLFGLPVVATQAMTVDKFLVGDFSAAGTLYDRWQPRVEVGYVDDDFTRNLVTILAEERLSLAVKQPKALVYGEFGNV